VDKIGINGIGQFTLISFWWWVSASSAGAWITVLIIPIPVFTFCKYATITQGG
jgi:hypothetical protein